MVLPYTDMNQPQVYMCSHPEPPSYLPPHPIPLGHPSTPAPSTLYHASNLDWWFKKHIFDVSWPYFASYCNGDIAEIKNTKSCFWDLLITQEIKQKFLYPSQKAKSRTLTQKDSNSGMLILFSSSDSMAGKSILPTACIPHDQLLLQVLNTLDPKSTLY